MPASESPDRGIAGFAHAGHPKASCGRAKIVSNVRREKGIFIGGAEECFIGGRSVLVEKDGAGVIFPPAARTGAAAPGETEMEEGSSPDTRSGSGYWLHVPPAHPSALAGLDAVGVVTQEVRPRAAITVDRMRRYFMGMFSDELVGWMLYG